MSIYRTWLHEEREDQKFPGGSFVYVADDLDNHMKHFPSGTYAVVEHTYRRKYDSEKGPKEDSYSLCLRNKSTGEWTSVSWYYEHQLTQVTDIELCKRLEQDILEKMSEKARGQVLRRTTKLGELL